MEIVFGSLPDWTGTGYGAGAGYWRIVFRDQLPAFEIRFRQIKTTASFIAFWKSDLDGYPVNGGKRGNPAQMGLREKVSGSLKIYKHGFHATMNPDQWKGERLWVVALFGEVERQGDKVAALEREIIGEIKL